MQLEAYLSKMTGVFTPKHKKADAYKFALNTVNKNPELSQILVRRVKEKGGLFKLLLSNILLKNIDVINRIIKDISQDEFKKLGLSFLNLYQRFMFGNNKVFDIFRDKDVRLSEHCLRFGVYDDILEARKNYVKSIANNERILELSLIAPLGNGVLKFAIKDPPATLTASFPYILTTYDGTASIYLVGGQRVATYSIPRNLYHSKAGESSFLLEFENASSFRIVSPSTTFPLDSQAADIVGDKIASLSLASNNNLCIRVLNLKGTIEWERKFKLKPDHFTGNILWSRDLKSLIVNLRYEDKNKSKILKISESSSKPLVFELKSKIIDVADLPLSMSIAVSEEGHFYVIDWDHKKTIYTTEIDVGDPVIGATSCFGFGVAVWTKSHLLLLDAIGNVYYKLNIPYEPKFIENPVVPLIISNKTIYVFDDEKLKPLKFPRFLGLGDVIDAAYSKGILFLLDKNGIIYCLNPILLLADELEESFIKELEEKNVYDLIKMLEDIVRFSPTNPRDASKLVIIQNRLCGEDFEKSLFDIKFALQRLSNKFAAVEGVDRAFDNNLTSENLSRILCGDKKELFRLISITRILSEIACDEDILNALGTLTQGILYVDYLSEDLTLAKLLCGQIHDDVDLDYIVESSISGYNRYNKVALIRTLKVVVDKDPSILALLSKKALENNSIAKLILYQLGYNIDELIAKSTRIKELLRNLPKKYGEIIEERLDESTQFITRGLFKKSAELLMGIITLLEITVELRKRMKYMGIPDEYVSLFDDRVLEFLRVNKEVSKVLSDIEREHSCIISVYKDINDIINQINSLKIANREVVRSLIPSQFKYCSELRERINEVKEIVNELVFLENRLTMIEEQIRNLDYQPKSTVDTLVNIRDLIYSLDMDKASQVIDKLERNLIVIGDINERIKKIKHEVSGNKPKFIEEDIEKRLHEIIQNLQLGNIDEALLNVKNLENFISVVNTMLNKINSLKSYIPVLEDLLSTDLTGIKDRIINEIYNNLKKDTYKGDSKLLEYKSILENLKTNIENSRLFLSNSLVFFTQIDDRLTESITENFNEYFNQIAQFLKDFAVYDALNTSKIAYEVSIELHELQNSAHELLLVINKLPQVLREIIQSQISETIMKTLLKPEKEFKDRVKTLRVKIEELRNYSAILDEIRAKYILTEAIVDDITSELLKTIVTKMRDNIYIFFREFKFKDVLEALTNLLNFESQFKKFDESLTILEKNVRSDILTKIIDSYSVKLSTSSLEELEAILTLINEVAVVSSYVPAEKELLKLINFTIQNPYVGLSIVKLVRLLDIHDKEALVEEISKTDLKNVDDVSKLATRILTLKGVETLGLNITKSNPMFAHLIAITFFEFSPSDIIEAKLDELGSKVLEIYSNIKHPDDLEKLIGYTALSYAIDKNTSSKLLGLIGADLAKELDMLVKTIAKDLNLHVVDVEQLIFEVVVSPMWSKGIESARKDVQLILSKLRKVTSEKRDELYAVLREILPSEINKVSASALFDSLQSVLEIFTNGIESLARKHIQIRVDGELRPNTWRPVKIFISNTGPLTFVIERAELHTFTVQEITFDSISILDPHSYIVGRSIARSQSSDERETLALFSLD